MHQKQANSELNDGVFQDRLEVAPRYIGIDNQIDFPPSEHSQACIRPPAHRDRARSEARGRQHAKDSIHSLAQTTPPRPKPTGSPRAKTDLVQHKTFHPPVLADRRIIVDVERRIEI